MKRITATHLREVLTRMPSLQVGVLGDVALDGYWTLAPEASIPSVETGLPTRPVRTQRYAPGAAGNVVLNLAALGCRRIHAFGITGPDPWGAELRRLLTLPAVDLSGLQVQAEGWATVAYIKPLEEGAEQHRLDFGDFNRPAEETVTAMLDRFRDALPSLDAVILNVQARAGLYSEFLQPRLRELVAANPRTLFMIDSRDPDFLLPGCALKLNAGEAFRCCAAELAGAPDTHPPIEDLAARLFARQQKPVFVTRGPDGITAHDHTGSFSVPGIRRTGPLDPTGAGDTVLASITAALAAGADPATAATLGNLAAAITIRQLACTGVATPDAIVELAGQQA